MKALILIWVLAGLTVMGAIFFVNRTVNQIVAQNPSEGLRFVEESSLEVVSYYGSDFDTFYPLATYNPFLNKGGNND